jgi:thiol:disulfide interchange protein/DsbC/DsbD-like thiol-disulfide interchange protein
LPTGFDILAGMKSLFRALLLSIGLLIPSTGRTASDHVEAKLIAEVEKVSVRQPFWVALHLKMDRDWHVYWTNPGDSGMAPKVKWTLPPGFKAGALQWPYPERIEAPPLVSYGYEGEVLLLAEITPSAPFTGTTIPLIAEADWLECADVCIPGSAELRLDLPVSPDLPSLNVNHVKLFDATRFRLPIKNQDWIVSAFTSDNRIRLALLPPESSDARLSAARFFPFEGGVIENAGVQSFRKERDGYILDLFRAETSTGVPARLRGVVVSMAGWRGPNSEQALEIDVPLQAKAFLPSAEGPRELSLGLALLFAFLGGILLNLMPCVLPVLSMKILGLVKEGASDRAEKVKQSFLYAAGVLVSFWVLAGALLFLRAGGEQLGWGFQLQSPSFIAFLCCLFFLLALSLFGLFEIGTSLIGAGDHLGNKGRSSAFFTGVLATVVATPCTAPFMGSALGFALTQPWYWAFAIFTSLALGLVVPYVAVSLSPGIARFVPKPGAWMETFKQVMGFLFMATVVWLLWVLSLQAGAETLVDILIGFLFIAVGGWIYGKWGTPLQSRRQRWMALAAAAALMIAGVRVSTRSLGGHSILRPTPTVKSSSKIPWEPYTEERLAALRADGRPVFIDFTAAWCLTCQVNDRVVFGQDVVAAAFERKGIAALKADWTSRDPMITKALQRYGRSGVPAYILYGRGDQTEFKVLPEVLTPGFILKEFERL